LCAQLAGDGENSPGQATEQRDATILRSLPGVGRIVLATLLAEAAEPLRRRDYHALRSLSGVAPVTRRSGKTCVVVRRYACNKRLANALYHWARLATQHDALSRRRYAALRQRGHSHGRALRTVADRLLSVACCSRRAGKGPRKAARSRPCSRTSCWMNWIANLSVAATGSCGTRMTVTSTSAVKRLADGSWRA